MKLKKKLSLFSGALLVVTTLSTGITPIKTSLGSNVQEAQARPWYPFRDYFNPDRPRRYPGGGYGRRDNVGGPTVYETFVIPDHNPMSWEQASRLCDRDGGQLVWRRNRKVCLKRTSF